MAPVPSLLALEIRTLSGDVVASLELPSEASLGAAQRELQARLGVPLQRQRLLHDETGLLSDPAQALSTLPSPSLALVQLSVDSTLGPHLMEAAEYGELDQVKALLGRLADPDFRDEDGETPLGVAVRRDDVELVALLCASGADPNKGVLVRRPGFKGVTPTIVGQLLQSGQLPGEAARAEEVWTPLCLAARWGRAGVVRALLEGGADVEACDLCSADAAALVEAAAPLRANDADPVGAAAGRPPLAEAARRGHEAICQELLRAGARAQRAASPAVVKLGGLPERECAYVFDQPLTECHRVVNDRDCLPSGGRNREGLRGSRARRREERRARGVP